MQTQQTYQEGGDEQTTTTTTLNPQDMQKISPTEWIQKNIINQASQQDKNWRQSYLLRVGIKQVDKQSSELNNSQLPTAKKPKSPLLQERQKQSSSLDNGLQIEQSYLDKSGFFQLDILGRTNQDVRNNYIQKLINNRIMQSGPSKKHQTMIIFDWDDTLLCTTYLGSYGFIDLPQDVNDQLLILNDSASKLLQKAAEHGDTYIITNAAQGWVEYSSKLQIILYFQFLFLLSYMPKVFSVIFDFKITVISARAGYEDLFPGDCSKWKVEAFKNIKKNFDSDVIRTLRQMQDMYWLSNIYSIQLKKKREFSYALIKTIKYRENPKPDELVKQQDLVSEKFEQIYTNLKNLTIRLEKKAQNV